ncbi:MAG TPA: MarR family transcriptional regulator [Spirochaetota bacterium]|nr:MarR family transcriptional regulator [Spirochaetota bacterium]
MIKRKGGFLISKIHQVSGRIFNRILQEEGINGINSAQGRILFALWEQDGIPITTLSKKTMLERSTLTGMLDRLERGNFICRKPSPDDRRVLLIHRTDKDRDLERKYKQISESMCDLFYKGMSKDEINLFEANLENILDNCIEEETRNG